MAEVIVGFVSAGVGIAAFAIQISKSIDALRQMRLKAGEAREDLTTLLGMLEILHQAVSLLKAWEGYQPVNGIIQHVQQRYDKIEPTLRDLLEKYQEKGDGHGRPWKKILARHPKQQIRDLREDINDLINILNLAFMAAQCQSPSVQELIPTTNKDSDPSQAQEGDPDQLEHEGDTDNTKASTSTVTDPSSNSHQEHHITLSTTSARSNTRGSRRYACSCYLTGACGRFWFLQYTPLSIFTGNRGSGCSCAGLRLRLALSKYGVPIAVVAGIGFMLDGSGLELRPALRVERVVKYTSPGFETIWRLENNLISLAEARQRFIELYRSDSSLRYHKDPAGNGYIQTLLKDPWGRGSEDQISLFHMLVTDCQMTLVDEDESLSAHFASWIEEGCHLTLLDLVLESGFDGSAIHAPLSKWRHPALNIWFPSQGFADPFLIEFVRTILKNSPSYPGSTNLHNVLLNGSFESAASWLRRSQPLETNVNLFGQTPLHIATTRPELCRLVLDAGHGIDVTDNNGVTPLMYAAAMGQTEVTKLLISRGANPTLRTPRGDVTFLDYALFGNRRHLALDALLAIQPNVESSVFQVLVRRVIIQASQLSCFVSPRELSFLTKIVQLSDDVNFTFKDNFRYSRDNNLMHYAFTLELASTLVQCGFNSFNQKNSEGRLAINHLVAFPNAPVIQLCIERGTDVGSVSKQGQTVFFELLSELRWLNQLTWETIDSIKLCLSAGADPFIADNCVCPCSPDGCHLSSTFLVGLDSHCDLSIKPGRVWIFEFLTILEEYRGIEAAEKMLLSLHRRVQCDKPHISMAHVCCHRGRGIECSSGIPWNPLHLQDEDIKEILDEESEFITALDMDMNRLASFGFSKLRTELMIHLKGMYETEKDEEDFILHQEAYEVDYIADMFKRRPKMVPRSWYLITRSMADYAFWLQHESSRAAKPLSQDFHKAGWFERRISWFLELMDVMEVTAEMLEEN
ncbi:hypothetical protein CDV31_015731 [Fusarium ambrosium]|uniref:Uncharacterized protein n=1 Tax=Fusarium ambrosium TaxID=131363 RepID=A0A428SKD0_9HYPO|nr:hypothetical protein CDV31_015731 [Fusarium ambrosium]